MTRTILYSRDIGPVGLSLELPAEDEMLGKWPSFLLSLGSLEVSWLWASQRQRPLPQGSRYDRSVAIRKKTGLTEESVSSLVDDLLERDIDDYGRALALVCVAENRRGKFEEVDFMRQHLNAFMCGQSAAVYLVLFQFGDSPIYIFVPRFPSAPALRSLEYIGVLPTTLAGVKPYAKMKSATLEVNVDSILRLFYD